MKKNKSWVNNYSTWILVVIVLVTVIIAVIFFYANSNKVKAKVENDVVIKVDGSPISVLEFNRAIRKNRAYVIDYFQKKYNVEQTDKFWITAINGEIPMDMLKEKAKKECIEIKMEQIVAQEKGILKDISYQGFLQQLKSENKRREEAIKNKQVVYGPSQYSEETYFDYVLFNAKLSVKKDMQENIDEEELKQFYDAKKNELYLSKGSIKINKIVMDFLNTNKESVFQNMIGIKAKLESGDDFKKISLEYSKAGADLEQQINMSECRKNLKSPVAQAALNLKVQEVSGIIEENGRFYILKCVERDEIASMYEPFSKVNKQVLSDCIESKYEETIKKRISEAKIELNERIYKEVNNK